MTAANRDKRTMLELWLICVASISCRYIQRFKVQDHLTGELAYCLTNMMAVVSFLETLDPHALGLADDDRVMSDMSDIQAISGKTGPAVPLINFQEGFDHTKALGHKVSQDIVGVAEEGIKVISDVVQDGYSKFFGRFLTTTDGSPIGKLGSKSSNKAGVLNRGSRSSSAASSLAATAAADAAASAEEKKRDATGLVSPAGATSEMSTINADARTESAPIEKTSSHVSAMEHAARVRQENCTMSIVQTRHQLLPVNRIVVVLITCFCTLESRVRLCSRIGWASDPFYGVHKLG